MERCWRAVGELLERCWTAAGEMLESCWRDFGERLNRPTVCRHPDFFSPVVNHVAAAKLCCFPGTCEYSMKYFANLTILFPSNVLYCPLSVDMSN